MKDRHTTRIFLTRHGQSLWNQEKRVTGQADPPLSDKGKAQAQILAEVLRPQSLTAIYTSTLQRAVDTALPTAASCGLPIYTKAALKEVHLGTLQGRFRDERDPEAQQLWRERARTKWTYRCPGGENYEDLTHRVVPCLRDILRRERSGSVLIVGHRNTNRVLLGALMGWAPEVMVTLNPRSKYLYEIVLKSGGSEVRTISLDEQRCGLTREGFFA